MSSTCLGLVCPSDRLKFISTQSTHIRWDSRTDSCGHDNVAVFSFPHNGQHGFDDVDIGEEIGLEGILHKSDGSSTLRQLLNGTDDG
jgi:hypothetical protein